MERKDVNKRKNKNKIVELTYETKNCPNTITGKITACGIYHILFDVNNTGIEISLKYNQLININNRPKKEK